MPEDISALHLVHTGDPALFAIVRLSLIVSLSAVMFAALIGVPSVEPVSVRDANSCREKVGRGQRPGRDFGGDLPILPYRDRPLSGLPRQSPGKFRTPDIG